MDGLTMTSSSAREFKNPYLDLKPRELEEGNDWLRIEGNTRVLSSGLYARLRCALDAGLARLQSHVSQLVAKSLATEEDGSVYTGTAGLVLLYLALYRRTHSRQRLQTAVSLSELLVVKPSRSSNRRRVSLLCGEAGSLAVKCAVLHLNSRNEEVQPLVQRISAMVTDVEESSSLPDELLYGRAGYLAALLFLRRQGVAVPRLSHLICRTVNAVLSSGRRLSRREGSPSPLMFSWHGKHYLGAAHGVAGILTMLLQVPEALTAEQLSEEVRPTVDHLASLQLPSGNTASSLESGTPDRLVQWCHGAPGLAHMYCLAYKVFGDDMYRRLAVSCCDLIWSRGLLTKGHGLCHGTAGNAYSFLHTYQITHDVAHLYRACVFADWCSGETQHNCPSADRPYSLFEGLTGTLYFLSDVQQPSDARFPAFIL